MQSLGLSSLVQRLSRVIATAGRQRERELAAQGQRLLRQMRAPIPQRAPLVGVLERWQRGAAGQIDAISLRIVALDAGMRHLNPQGVLDRGYSIVTSGSGNVVQDSADLALGDDLNLRFARGQAGAKVTGKSES